MRIRNALLLIINAIAPLALYCVLNNPALADAFVNILDEIQAGCNAAHGFKTFGSQVKCIETGTVGLTIYPNTGDIQLYLLTAEKLADDVAKKKITVASARVELQKAYLDFRERRDRKNAEASAQANAAKLETQRQEAEVERRREVAEAQSRSDEAARQYAQAQANAQMMADIQNCVALAYERQNALAASPNPSVRNVASGQQGLRNMAGVTMENACQSDPNWYRSIPVAPQTSHCAPDYLGGYNCTVQ